VGLFDFFRSDTPAAPVQEVASPALRAAIIGEREKRSTVYDELSTEEVRPSYLAALGYGAASTAGVAVNQFTAMGSAAVWACVNNISQDLAGLPLQLFRKTDTGIEPVRGHASTTLLNLQASPLQNSFHLRQSTTALVLLRGNAYARIERDGRQNLLKLHYKHPDETTVTEYNGRLWYKFDGDGKTYADYEVLHFKGLSLDGKIGVSVLHYHRETIGKGLAASRAAANFYKNGAKPSGVLESANKLTDPAYKRLRESFETQYAGIENSGKPLLLEEGLSYKAITLTPEDAQYVEQLKMTWAEVCAIYRMPPHKTGNLERSTNNNIEQQSLDYVGDTLMPWAINFEQEYRLKLLRPSEVESHYYKHNVSALMRADATARGNFYAKLFQVGAFSPNDILALEERNGIGPAGDERFVQVNMMPLSRMDELITAQIEGKKAPNTPPTDPPTHD
jgi:HK97 family phage portal protein